MRQTNAKNRLGGYRSRDKLTEPIGIQLLDSLVFLSQSHVSSFTKSYNVASTVGGLRSRVKIRKPPQKKPEKTKTVVL